MLDNKPGGLSLSSTVCRTGLCGAMGILPGHINTLFQMSENSMAYITHTSPPTHTHTPPSLPTHRLTHTHIPSTHTQTSPPTHILPLQYTYTHIPSTTHTHKDPLHHTHTDTSLIIPDHNLSIHHSFILSVREDCREGEGEQG